MAGILLWPFVHLYVLQVILIATMFLLVAVLNVWTLVSVLYGKIRKYMASKKQILKTS